MTDQPVESHVSAPLDDREVEALLLRKTLMDAGALIFGLRAVARVKKKKWKEPRSGIEMEERNKRLFAKYGTYVADVTEPFETLYERMWSVLNDTTVGKNLYMELMQLRSFVNRERPTEAWDTAHKLDAATDYIRELKMMLHRAQRLLEDETRHERNVEQQQQKRSDFIVQLREINRTGHLAMQGGKKEEQTNGDD
jgi:hypothetical protein